MKGLKSTIALAVVLAGLGAYIYFVTWKQPAGADAAKKTDKVFDVAADKIDEVTLTTASGEAVTAKKANATSWTLTAPAEAPADQAEIGALTNALATADVVRVVDENPSNLNDYGLSNPRIAVSFKASGDKDYRHLFIGEKTPTGGDLFAKRDDKKVFLIASFQENSLNKSAFDLRDKSVLKVDRDKIDSVDLTSGSQNVTLAKDGSEWKVTKPEQVRADYGTVEGLIGKLETVKMKSIAATVAAPADLKKYGLDKPQATVNLNAGSSKATLLIGNKTDDNNLYARDASKSMIVTIDGAILDDIKKAPDDYRRKDLFEFRAYNANRVDITRNGQSYVFERVKSTDEKTPDKWKRTSPNPGDVDKDKFDAFLAKLANMRVSTFQPSTANTGTDKPAMTVSVKFDDNKKEDKVTFGQSGSDVFAIRPNEPGAAKTDAADFNESVKTLEELGK